MRLAVNISSGKGSRRSAAITQLKVVQVEDERLLRLDGETRIRRHAAAAAPFRPRLLCPGNCGLEVLKTLAPQRLKGGGRTRARTWDPMIKSHLLYQLSYAPGSNRIPSRDGVV